MQSLVRKVGDVGRVDLVFVDEAHHTAADSYQQILRAFPAAVVIGLTATPAAHTYGFFHKNLVMEYSHEEAVADNVNVDFEDVRTVMGEPGKAMMGTAVANGPDRARIAAEQLRCHVHQQFVPEPLREEGA